jgi:hypothetical protein
MDGIRTYADVSRQEPVWKIPNLVQAGTVTIIGGDRGCGKSSLGADWTARMTSGRALPGADPAEPEGVIMISPEDSAECNIGWRLDAAGANGELVYDMTTTAAGDFLAERDLPKATAVVAEAPMGVGMLWIDPLSAATEVSMSSPKVRRVVMKPLMRFAEQTGVAVVVVAHNTKAGVLAGSQELSNCARSVLSLSVDPDDSRLRLLRLTKSNLAMLDSPPVRYRLEGAPPRTRVIYYEGDDAPAPGVPADAPGVEACNPAPQERMMRVMRNNPLPMMRFQRLALESGVPVAEARATADKLVAGGQLVRISANVLALPQEPADMAAVAGS